MDEIEAVERSVRIVRRQAGKPRSPLARVIGNAAYRIFNTGWIEASDNSGLPLGGVVVIQFKKRQPVDAIVPAWADAWPRGSPNYKYSRRFDYTPFRAHVVSRRGIGFLIIDVDMRVRRIIYIAPEYEDEIDVWQPLRGHCPVLQSRPDWWD